MSETTAVAVRDGSPPTAVAPARAMQMLRPIADPAEVIAAQNATRDLVQKALVDGRDYGLVPGTGDKKNMLKPGAERVALAFGCFYGTPEILEREVDHDREVQWLKTKWVDGTKPENWEALKARGVGRNKKFGQKWVWQEKADERGVSIGLYRYVVRVPVINRATGEVVGSGVGSCSSMESKYIDRPRDSENTILKMAFKRGMVAGCLTTFGLSDQFTQDVEDMPQFTGDAGQGSPAPQSANDRDEEATSETPLTIELALAMPLPGAKTAFNGKGGTPLGQLDPKMLTSIRKWFNGKIEDAEQSGNESSALNYRYRAACDRIINMRAPDPAAPVDTTLAPGKVQDALTPNEGEQRPDPTMKPSPTASESAPVQATTTTSATAIANKTTALIEQIEQLLTNEKFGDEDRAAVRKRIRAADTDAALLFILEEIEKEARLPF